MLYRNVPKTGDSLSILGFGCMRFPERGGRIDEDRAARQLRMAIDGGVNYLDTAMPYHGGESEPFLGRVLTGGYRERVRLATKLPHWSTRSREEMDGMLDQQLRRLCTGRIDYYLVHNLQGPSWERFEERGGLEFLDGARADGRIGAAGFSFHGDRQAFRRIVDGYDWDFCQIQYNYLDEYNQAGTEGLEYAAERGLGVVVMEPLRGGALTGRIPPRVQSLWEGSVAQRTPAEWALRWVWDRPEVTVVLSGMNDEGHIRENLRVASEAMPNSLSASELALVEQVRDTYRSLMRAACTGCRYCMPCPAGVNIPACFEMFNSYHMFDRQQSARFHYIGFVGGVISGRAGLASQCVECGRCEELCPQHLPIRDLLKQVAKDLELPLMKPLIRFAQWLVGLHGRIVLRPRRERRGRRRDRPG